MMVMHVNVETLGQAEKIVYDVEHWPQVILPKSFVIHHISDAMFNFFEKKKAHGLVFKLCLIISEVLKLSDLSVLSDIETSGPTLILVLLVQMSDRGLESL